MYDLDQLRREEFPFSTDVTYLNHAAIAPLPQRSKRAIQEAIEGLSNNPSDFFTRHGLPGIEAMTNMVAQHINAASPAEIVATTTTSAALNAVAQAIEWRPRENVLFCDVEFPANAYPWLSLARDGAASRCVPAQNGGLTLDRVRDFADEHTRAVAVSAVQFLSGQRADLSGIGRFCHENGLLFIVDAIQAIGHMPIDVQAMHIDVLATGGQKSLLAMPGVGFLYVRQAVAEQMRPRLIHSNATNDYIHWLAYDLTPLPGAGRFSSGTPNIAGIMGMNTSLSLLAELGTANIDAHTTGLTHYGAEKLRAAGYEVITPLDTAGPILTFCSPFDSATTDRFIQDLAERQVVVGKHLDAEGDAYVRLSFHAYNVPAEIDRFLSEMEGFIN